MDAFGHFPLDRTTLFCVVGGDGEFIEVNAAWETLLGYPTARLTARGYYEFIHPEDKAATRDYLRRLHEGSASVVFAARIRHAEGSCHSILWQAVRLDDEGFYALGIDASAYQAEPHIAAYLEAEQNLAENANLLSALFKVAPIGIALVDRNGRFVHVNPVFCTMFGYTEYDLLGQNACMLFPKSLAESVAQAYQDPDSSIEPLCGEFTGQRRDGTDFGLELQSRKLVQFGKSFTITLAMDVSFRGKTNHQGRVWADDAKANEERLRLIIENLPIMIDGVDEKGNFVVWNYECERVTGFSATEILHNPHALNLLYPDTGYRAKVRIALRDAINSEPCIRQGEWAMSCKDGSEKTIAWSVNTGIHAPGITMLGIGEDVSERNQALRQLRENEERLRLVVENMPMMFAAYDAAGTPLMWNHHCEKVTGHAAKTMLGNPDAVYLLYPQPEHRRQWRMWLETEVYAEWETEVFCRNGEYKTIQWTNLSGQLPIPGWTHWVVGEDVTALRKKHRALDESKALLAAVLDNMDTGLAVTDGQQNFVYVNAAYAAVYGYAPEELLEAPLSTLMGLGSQCFVYRHYFSFYTGAHGNEHREQTLGKNRDNQPVTATMVCKRLEQKIQDETKTFVLWIIE